MDSGTILLIEDDKDLARDIGKVLTEAKYRVVTVASSRQAFQAIFKSPPDVVILDINLPDLDGFHIAKELKRNMMLRHIPVITLSSRLDFLEKMRSLDVIMDEYLVKPIDLKDLLLRTQLVKRRSQSNLDANPLTRLPGNIAIVATIKEKLAAQTPYAVGYADLNNFKAYNDKYGFSNGDLVIKFAAETIVKAVEALSPDACFIGHVGGDDFIFVCGYDMATDVCQKITETFDKEAPRFYNDEDRHNGYIVVEDRRGIVSRFPLVSIAVGMVSDEGGKFSNLGQINHSLTQLKKYAKSFQGSAYVRDRRTLTQQMAESTFGPGSAAASSSILDSITSALGSYMPGKLNDIIRDEAITVLFQPIIDMKTDEVMGHESLARGPAGSPLEFPDTLFQTARTGNIVPVLDRLCVKKVMEASKDLHNGLKLFVNIFPETLLDRELFVSEVVSNPIIHMKETIFELSGSHRASDPSQVFSILGELKKHNLKICIDASVALGDTGLEYLPDLNPDYIKLSMTSFKDMLSDYHVQEEFTRTVRVLQQTGAQIICTKLESRSDSHIAMKNGIVFGQGFLFARPAQANQHTS